MTGTRRRSGVAGDVGEHGHGALGHVVDVADGLDVTQQSALVVEGLQRLGVRGVGGQPRADDLLLVVVALVELAGTRRAPSRRGRRPSRAGRRPCGW